MKISVNFCSGMFCLIFLILFSAGCKTRDAYEEDRAKLAAEHFERSKWSLYQKEHVFTLDECIDLALKFNLDIKVAKLEEQAASESAIAEALGMLPELTATNTDTWRNNVAASGSQAMNSEGATYSYSTSSDQDQNNFNLDLAFSFLDFGIAALNTSQANDRTQIREQRTRRVAQNLQADVVRAYFQVAAAQKAMDIANDLLKKCQSRYELIVDMESKKLISPFRAFDEARRFFDMEKRLTNYTRNYEASRSELCALLGLTVGNDILVDTSMLNVNRPPEFDLPKTQVMEQIALLQRPELYEIDMQRHVNVLELYKTILMMFPNVRMYMDFSQSSNSFLYHSTWMELGIRAAYNLLKLPQQIAKAKSMHTQILAEEARGFAQAVGIIAQVRIAEFNYRNAIDRFYLDNRIYTAYSENLKNAEASIRTSGGLSQLELDHIRLSTAETEIERLNSLGSFYITYYRLLNSLGIDKRSLGSSDPFVDACQKKLAVARYEAEEEIRKAWEEAKKDQWEQLPEKPPVFANPDPEKTIWQKICGWFGVKSEPAPEKKDAKPADKSQPDKKPAPEAKKNTAEKPAPEKKDAKPADKPQPDKKPAPETKKNTAGAKDSVKVSFEADDHQDSAQVAVSAAVK